jgi:hypothetical protein
VIGTCVDPALTHWGWERVLTLVLLLAVLIPAGVVAVLEIRDRVRHAWRDRRSSVRQDQVRSGRRSR